MTRIRIEQGDPGWVNVFFPYDPVLVDKIKTVPGRQFIYDEKYWRVPYKVGIETVLAKLFSPETVGIATVKRPAKYINGICRSFLSFLIKNLKN